MFVSSFICLLVGWFRGWGICFSVFLRVGVGICLHVSVNVCVGVGVDVFSWGVFVGVCGGVCAGVWRGTVGNIFVTPPYLMIKNFMSSSGLLILLKILFWLQMHKPIFRATDDAHRGHSFGVILHH